VNTSRKGRHREHQSRALLEAQGYVVIRSAASLGRFDLVAVGPADILLIQVKANRWPTSSPICAPSRRRQTVGDWFTAGATARRRRTCANCDGSLITSWKTGNLMEEEHPRARGRYANGTKWHRI
jgi:hypothetical protein